VNIHIDGLPLDQPHVTSQIKHPAVGKVCLIRCYGAGVFAGVVTYVDGKEVHLQWSYRIWRWEGAFTLTKVAREGIEGGRTVYNDAEHYLTDVLEIIPMTPAALETVKKHNE